MKSEKAEPYPSLSKTLRGKALVQKLESEYETYPDLLKSITDDIGLSNTDYVRFLASKYNLTFRTWAIKSNSQVVGSVTSILRPWPKNKKDKDPERFILKICFLSSGDLFSKSMGHAWACYKLFKKSPPKFIEQGDKIVKEKPERIIIEKPFKETKPEVKKVILEKIKYQQQYKEYPNIDVV